MEKKYTPGPWYLGDEGDDNVIEVMYDYGMVPVANVPSGFSDIDGSANAHLISSAPDLLEALEGLLELTEDPDNDASPEESIFTFARAAIAKAYGRE